MEEKKNLVLRKHTIMIEKQDKGTVRLSLLPVSSLTSLSQWADWFSTHSTWVPDLHISDTLVFSRPLRPEQKDMAYRTYVCWLLVLQKQHFATTEFFPEEPEDVVNILVKNNAWKAVPLLRTYLNPRLQLRMDPEYLMIYWCKSLENFDTNNTALLPSYPKDLFNRPFTPREIRDVCLQVDVFRQQQRLLPLSQCAPFFSSLVSDPFGLEVLQTVFNMLTAREDKDSFRMKRILEQFLNRFPTKTKDWRFGFHFLGMASVQYRPECLLTEYLLSGFFFFPTSSVLKTQFALDDATLRLIEQMKNDLYREAVKGSILYQYDWDPKTKKNVRVPIRFLFFDKTAVQRYVVRLKKPRYFLFFEQLMQRMRCKERYVPT